MQPPLTRADIVSRVGVPQNVMTFWVRWGVLQPIDAPKGTGTPLKFQWYEVNIATIMNQLRILGVKSEGMLSIGRVYREAIAYFDGLGLNDDQVHAIWSYYILEKNFIKGEAHRKQIIRLVNTPDFDREKHQNLVEIAERSEEEEQEYLQERINGLFGEIHGAQRMTNELAVLIHEKINAVEFYRHLDAFLTVTKKPKATDPIYANIDEMTYFWRVGEGDDYRFAWGPGAGGKARDDGAVAMIAVDVSAALHRVWNPTGSVEGA